LIRRGEMLEAATWDEALARASELLGSSGGVLASQGLSNEAFWVLGRLGPRLPGALWPRAGEAWPVESKIQNLMRCKSIVLVGLDAWNDLPVVALWIRKAVLAGAKLTVLGDRNGLWRNTATWLRGDPLSHLSEITASDGPVAVLVHPLLLPAARTAVEELVHRLGATGETGLVGAPLLGANGRGAMELAPNVARGDVDQVLTSKAILAFGNESWSDLKVGSFARVVLATAGAVPEQNQQIDVVLPLAHPYEQQASLVNLEGRVQHQEGGASPQMYARTDWGVIGEIASRLGVTVPDGLETLRRQIASDNPALAEVVHEEALIARV
jgi:NADH dehydrogenase/NADH:ubiquinone oxidoreductase subunit G